MVYLSRLEGLEAVQRVAKSKALSTPTTPWTGVQPPCQCGPFFSIFLWRAPEYSCSQFACVALPLLDQAVEHCTRKISAPSLYARMPCTNPGLHCAASTPFSFNEFTGLSAFRTRHRIVSLVAMPCRLQLLLFGSCTVGSGWRHTYGLGTDVVQVMPHLLSDYFVMHTKAYAAHSAAWLVGGQQHCWLGGSLLEVPCQGGDRAQSWMTNCKGSLMRLCEGTVGVVQCAYIGPSRVGDKGFGVMPSDLRPMLVRSII